MTRWAHRVGEIVAGEPKEKSANSDKQGKNSWARTPKRSERMGGGQVTGDRGQSPLKKLFCKEKEMEQQVEEAKMSREVCVVLCVKMGATAPG